MGGRRDVLGVLFFFLNICNKKRLLKSILFKKILEKAVDPKKLQRTAPIFQANTHQNMGQSFAIFLGQPIFQVFSYKKWTLRFSQKIWHTFLQDVCYYVSGQLWPIFCICLEWIRAQRKYCIDARHCPGKSWSFNQKFGPRSSTMSLFTIIVRCQKSMQFLR